MVDKESDLEKQESQQVPDGPEDCSCTADPFASLPAELQPKQKSWSAKLRKATCPGCGLVFWTNRQTDLCGECEKNSVKPYS